MERLALFVYDWLHARKWVCYLCLTLIVCLCAALALSRLSFKEDISDFLPNDKTYRESMSIYRATSASDRIFAIFKAEAGSPANQDSLVRAVRKFSALAAEYGIQPTAQVDYDKVLKTIDFALFNAPLLLTDEDFERMESMACKDSVDAALSEALQTLLFPSGALLSGTISRDPLGLFSPLLTRLASGTSDLRYSIYDDCIFSPDGSFALVMLDSPYGGSETKQNALLLRDLQKISESFDGVDLELTGAPVIAVLNARQIKKDSIWAICISVLLILALLLYSLRSLRLILLIVASLAFGWIFAMAGISLAEREISAIVVGIASIIIGIAVNYPLHFVSHLQHSPSPREVLREVIRPLSIGNITTVGAFCALIPLNSTALHDLGIFAALMLVGNILFVAVFLPQLCGEKKIVDSHEERESESQTCLSSHRPKPLAIILPLSALTLVFGFFSFKTDFDTDMRNINYLTPQQKSLLSQISVMQGETEGHTRLYYAFKADSLQEAVRRREAAGFSGMVASISLQSERISRWENFVSKNRALLVDYLRDKAESAGFSPDAFEDFFAILDFQYRPQELSYFATLASADLPTVGNLAVALRNVPDVELAQIRDEFNEASDGSAWAFDIQGLNGSIASSLSNNFNYIGWACSLIVFFFLWFSFGKLGLAVIAFMPMAVSWLWILGAMALLGIKFNLVNIILATFIFGQGDDYSIFVTEGLLYERKYGRPILASYKRSIVLSALIMFVGMGVLVFARHPALHSLGLLSILGMVSVVCMTFLIPPLLFDLLHKRQ